MEAPLLVELLTEELPPKSLQSLSQSFASELFGELTRSGFADIAQRADVFATPRRLAVRLPKVADRSPDSTKEISGPSVGAPQQAIDGFARKFGFDPGALTRKATSKGDVYVAQVKTAGQPLEDVLANKVEAALKSLPVPKLMRWGQGEAQFVRPVHGLVMLHGTRVVPGRVLGLDAGNSTSGHRFMGKPRIALREADEYEARLLTDGMVIADFAARRDEIRKQLEATAKRLQARLVDYEGLLDEVTALVEHPSVYAGEFDAGYLEVPHECLTLTMRQHQRYFPLFDDAGGLLPRFLIVSNMKVADPRHIVGGNERVVRPRLEDARFFYNQDRKIRLEARVPELAKVVYHNKLGSQRDRMDRIKLLSGEIAHRLGADRALAEQAAELCKADLLTGMVGEFPELQGVMGRYYALHDGEPKEVAEAIEAHYRPRFAGDRLPESKIACAVALADKLDALAGLFGIGQTPTGDRDPFGLRRAAIGMIRILVERNLDLSLFDLVNAAFQTFHGKAGVGDAHTDVEMFVFERARGYFMDMGFTANEVESVLCLNPVRIDLVPKQLPAERAFLALSEAESLAAANKRVANILKQAAAKGESFANAEHRELKEPAERELLSALRSVSQKAKPLFDQGDYTGYLKAFALLKSPVDRFFESVMVMVDDENVRRSRLALLTDLRTEMNRFADISKLAA